MKIAIAGTGYVGLSNVVLLAQHNEVHALDIDPVKVEKLNKKISPIEDREIEDYLSHQALNLWATLDPVEAYTGADFVIIATPTDYDAETNYFNTSSIEVVIQQVMSINPTAVMRVRSETYLSFGLCLALSKMTMKATSAAISRNPKTQVSVNESMPNFCLMYWRYSSVPSHFLKYDIRHSSLSVDRLGQHCH